MTALFSAAVFDLDGTLIDSYAAIHESLNHALRTLGKEPVSLHATRKMVGHGLDSLIETAVGREEKEEGIELFRERYEEVGPEMTILLPGVEEVTAELEKRGIPMGIASNKPSDFSVQILEALGILERFVVVTGPDEGFAPKPDPAMVVHVLEALETEADEALFVGDMPVDVATARASGMKVAVLSTGSSSREELANAGPDFMLSNLMQVLRLFHKPVY